MEGYARLDIDNVARIGLMFLDGDCMENVLKDQYYLDYDDIDYAYEDFISLKKVLMKIERINPELSLIAVLWQKRPDNGRLAAPIVVGSQFPGVGWEITEMNAEMLETFVSGKNTVRKQGQETSNYYPVRNSDADITGVLELISVRTDRLDI